MQIGIIYPQTELRGDPEAVRRIGVAAEEMGYHSLVAYDHVIGASHDREPKLWGPYTEHHPFHDPLMMFAYLAGITRRIEFVTGILILPQRQTVLVARQVADLDLLCDERFRLGVGLGWNYVEYDALNEDFHTRGKRVGEQIELLRTLWSEPLVDFTGSHHRVDRAALLPRPRRQIPIWMGGFADVALRRAAAIADGFIFADATGTSVEMLATLRTYIAESDEPERPFGFQCNMLAAKTADACVDMALRWHDAGGTHVAVNTMGKGFATIDDHLRYMEEVRSALSGAGL